MFTVSDTPEEKASALDRQTAYRNMMEIALEIAVE
jgi:purine-nucleoside phosphorylase